MPEQQVKISFILIQNRIHTSAVSLTGRKPDLRFFSRFLSKSNRLVDEEFPLNTPVTVEVQGEQTTDISVGELFMQINLYAMFPDIGWSMIEADSRPVIGGFSQVYMNIRNAVFSQIANAIERQIHNAENETAAGLILLKDGHTHSGSVAVIGDEKDRREFGNAIRMQTKPSFTQSITLTVNGRETSETDMQKLLNELNPRRVFPTYDFSQPERTFPESASLDGNSVSYPQVWNMLLTGLADVLITDSEY